ncbi:MAG: VOC family protein [Chlorobi bacterium]|nr:VOC family protein [Chlorobiota bacterium]MCI0716589.1 VOC family protein [Chlorobiota bacterium]
MKTNRDFKCPQILFLLLSTLLNLQAFTQDAFTKSESGTIQLKPNFTAITVKNIDSSIAWYKKTLGLVQRNRVDSEERGFKQAVLTGSGIMIELVELKLMLSPQECLKDHQKGTELLGYYKFGFVVMEFDVWIKQLELLGVSFWGKVVTDEVSGQRTFLIADPDGNLIQFFDS